MAGEASLLGVDIGTTKVAAVIGDRGEAMKLLGAASVPCHGLRRGAVVDVAETTRALQEAVARAQRMAGVELGPAWVGVTGQHLECVNTHAELLLARANRQVTYEDVQRVMEASVASVAVPADREIIHAISRGFSVDEETRVRNPVGLSANRIRVETHLVTAPRNLMNNVRQCVERAGLEIGELVAEPIATADAILTTDEQELGVLVVDIGGGTTDLALFVNGTVAYTGAVPAAGNNITHDLAVALGVTHPQAEQIKLAYGHARAAEVSAEQLIVLPRSDEERTTSRWFIAQVIEARVHEIFRLISKHLTEGEGKWPVPGGAVLSGGSSLLPGLAAVAQDALGCRCRLARPSVASGPVHLLENPSLATGVGLVYYAHREARLRRYENRPPVRVLPFVNRVIVWVKDLFTS